MRMNFLFSVLLSFISSSSLAEERLMFSGGAPLYTHQPAIIVPILEEAFSRMGIGFSAQYLPSRRSLVMSNSGRTDGELHRIFDLHKVTEGAFPNLVRIDTKMMSVFLSLFSSQELDIKGVDDLSGLIIGYQAGRKNIKKMLEEEYLYKHVLAVNTDLQAFHMLARGRLDVVVSESFLGHTIVNRDPALGGIKEILRVKETPIYSYIHIKHQKLLPRLNATLEAMIQDGTHQEIRSSVEKRLLREGGKRTP